MTETLTPAGTRLRTLLAQMIRIRMVEETIAERYGEWEMRCPTHLSIGQEAPAVGVCAALEPRDYVLSSHRAHAHYLAKGGDLAAMIAEIYGRRTGCCGGRGGSMHLIDLDANFLGSAPIVGGSIPVGVGAAFSSWMKGEDRATVVFLGEGATEEGVFAESMNFAAVKSLPVIFACENNFFSVYTSLADRQSPKRDRLLFARSQGLATGTADGNDVEAVRAATAEAVTRARTGGGPTYLEFDTYRWREHCGPNYDNELGYRTVAEFEAWQKRDPIVLLEAKLVSAGELAPSDSDEIRAGIRREIDDAFAHARSAPFPEPDTMYRGLFRSELG